MNEVSDDISYFVIKEIAMKNIVLFNLVLAAAATAVARDAEFANAPYMNAALPAEERAEDLISKMSVREKVAVLCTTTGFRSKDGCELYFHDPMAAVAAFHPEICSYTNLAVTVDLHSGAMTPDAKPDPRHGILRVVRNVDCEAFRRKFDNVKNKERYARE